MKKIRIGCGAGCACDRLEPAIELVEKGNLDYIVFECLAERTISNAQLAKLKDPKKGYTPMLEVRMRNILKPAKKNGTKIITNMGAANPSEAVKLIIEIAKDLGVHNLKIAMISGDDITDKIHKYKDVTMWQTTEKLGSIDGEIISANVYLGGDPIKKALDEGADIVVTGRVADPALFVGPIKHEFGWTSSDKYKIGQATLLGHLLECAGQLTGGYYADPGFKDVENLHLLGFPIAEIGEDGEFIVTKVQGSGGLVSVDTCKEQLLYEISDPSNYITPDAIADFSHVTFQQVGKDMVHVSNANSLGEPNNYKVNVGYCDCYVGEGEISFGGLNSLNRATLCADIIEKRLKLVVGAKLEEFHVDYIGFNSLYKDKISNTLSPSEHNEIRLHVAGRAKNFHDAELVSQEIDFLYTNGPAGSCGIRNRVNQIISIGSILIPRTDVQPKITYMEV